MTNPTEDFSAVTGGTGFMDRDIKAALQGTLDSLGGESETQRRVRWSATSVELYTGLYALYEELRETGHAYAWATAYEASGMANLLVADIRDLVSERIVPPTQEPTPPPSAPCGTTQHCASWGWCHRCDPRAAKAVPLVVKAVEAIGVPAGQAGFVYSTVMALLRKAVWTIPEDARRVRCALAVQGVRNHFPHPWEPQPGVTDVVCPGSGLDQEDPCPGK